LEIINEVVPNISIKSAATLGKDGFIDLLKQANEIYISDVNNQNAMNGIQFKPAKIDASGT